MINLFSIPFILFYAVLFGVTMKIADLLDEHGLKWFKGSTILFGILWGGFGALLLLSNNIVANIVLAMVIVFIIRLRIDYLNHGIATAIILITFLFAGVFMPSIFLIFFFIFVIFGSLKDYIGDVLKRKHWVYHLNELMLYYPIPTFVYCLFAGNWIVFFVFLLCTISYDLTRYYGMKIIKRQKI